MNVISGFLVLRSKNVVKIKIISFTFSAEMTECVETSRLLFSLFRKERNLKNLKSLLLANVSEI